MNKLSIFKDTLRDRAFVISLIATVVILVVVLLFCTFNIHPSELQVPIRNTVFGLRYTYQEQWYNEFAFVGFVLLIGILHTLLSIKLYDLKDRRYAIAFQWLTAFMLLISLFIFIAIFKVIAIVQ